MPTIENLADIVTWAFFAANAGRIVAYFPQLLAAWRCQNGATSVSRATWGYFALAHFTGILYGHFVIHDRKMALVFLGNFLACSLLVAVVTWKKRRHQRFQGHRSGMGGFAKHISLFHRQFLSGQ